MTVKKLEFSCSEETIEAFAKRFDKKFGIKDDGWNEKGDKLTFKKKDTVLGSITFFNDKLVFEGSDIIEFAEILIVEKKEAEKLLVTKDKVINTPLRNLFSNTSLYNGVDSNITMFNSVNSLLSELGIKEVVSNKLTELVTKDELTLYIESDCSSGGVNCEDGYSSRLKNVLFDMFEDKTEKNKTIFSIGNVSNPLILSPIINETVSDLTFGEMLVGKYYGERNIVHLYFNPFKITKITKDLKELPSVFSSLKELLTSVSIKKVDTKAFNDKLFVHSFLKGTKEKITSLKTQIKNVETTILNSEKSIRSSFVLLEEHSSELEFLETNIKSNGDGLFSEIDLAKKLPYVKNIELDTSSIKISFAPTKMVLNDFSVDGKNFGKRSFYTGDITFDINPTDFKFKGDVKHPHTSGSSICFGSGEGRNKIYECLAKNKICSLCKLLWFWIKTYRPANAYSGMTSHYTYCMINGVPVWDEHDVLIEPNDKKRIDSGEQGRLDLASDFKKKREFYLSQKIM